MDTIGLKWPTRLALALVCLALLLPLSQVGRNIIHFQSNTIKEFPASFSWVLASLILSVPCSFLLRDSSRYPRLLRYCFGGLLGALFLHTLGFNWFQYYLMSQHSLNAESPFEIARVIGEAMTCATLLVVVSIGYREWDFDAANRLPIFGIFGAYGFGLIFAELGLIERIPLLLLERLNRPPLSWVALEGLRLFFRPMAVALGGVLLCFSCTQRLLLIPHRINCRVEVVASLSSVILLLYAPWLVLSSAGSSASLLSEGVYLGAVMTLAGALLLWSFTHLRMSRQLAGSTKSVSLPSVVMALHFIGCSCVIAGMLVVVLTIPGPLRLMWDPPSDFLSLGALPGLLMSVGSLGYAMSCLLVSWQADGPRRR